MTPLRLHITVIGRRFRTFHNLYKMRRDSVHFLRTGQGYAALSNIQRAPAPESVNITSALGDIYSVTSDFPEDDCKCPYPSIRPCCEIRRWASSRDSLLWNQGWARWRAGEQRTVCVRDIMTDAGLTHGTR